MQPAGSFPVKNWVDSGIIHSRGGRHRARGHSEVKQWNFRLGDGIGSERIVLYSVSLWESGGIGPENFLKSDVDICRYWCILVGLMALDERCSWGMAGTQEDWSGGELTKLLNILDM